MIRIFGSAKALLGDKYVVDVYHDKLRIADNISAKKDALTYMLNKNINFSFLHAYLFHLSIASLNGLIFRGYLVFYF